MFHLHVCDLPLKLKSTVWVVWPPSYCYRTTRLPNHLEKYEHFAHMTFSHLRKVFGGYVEVELTIHIDLPA